MTNLNNSLLQEGYQLAYSFHVKDISHMGRIVGETLLRGNAFSIRTISLREAFEDENLNEDRRLVYVKTAN